MLLIQSETITIIVSYIGYLPPPHSSTGDSIEFVIRQINRTSLHEFVVDDLHLFRFFFKQFFLLLNLFLY